MEDAARKANERDDEEKFKRIDDVVSNLRGSQVEAEDECNGEAEDRRAAQDRVNADQYAGGHAPCEFFRCGSHAKEREDGKGDVAIEPVVTDRRVSLR